MDETSRIVAVTDADKYHVQRILGIAGVTVDIDAWGHLHVEAARHREQATASLREERDALRALVAKAKDAIERGGPHCAMIAHRILEGSSSGLGEG